MAKGPKKGKNPFNKLDEEFKERVVSSTDSDLHALLGTVAKNEEQNLAAMKADQDLKELRSQVTNAAAGYKEGTKANKQRMKFIIQVMSDRGNAQAAEIVSLNLAGA